MSRIFEPLAKDGTSEGAQRSYRFLRAFLFDKTATDENWSDAMEALVLLLGSQLMKSDDPVRSIANLIELMELTKKKAQQS